VIDASELTGGSDEKHEQNQMIRLQSEPGAEIYHRG
jgi:hypothetical protein